MNNIRVFDKAYSQHGYKNSEVSTNYKRMNKIKTVKNLTKDTSINNRIKRFDKVYSQHCYKSSKDRLSQTKIKRIKIKRFLLPE